MVNTIEALFDGKVFYPQKPVNLKANTRVRIIIEDLLPEEDEYTLDQLLAGKIETEKEIDWGKSEGKEVW